MKKKKERHMSVKEPRLVFRQREELYARLASLPSLATVPAEDKRALCAAVSQLCFFFTSNPLTTGVLPRHRHPREARAWALDEEMPYYWVVLMRFHPWARKLIHEVLDGKPLSLRRLAKFEHAMLICDPQTQRTRYSWEPKALHPCYAHGALIVDLSLTLRQVPFPFHRCPVCQTVFVSRHKTKRFCSRTCTMQAFSSAENPERRRYFREKVAARRQAAKLQRPAA